MKCNNEETYKVAYFSQKRKKGKEKEALNDSQGGKKNRVFEKSLINA